MRVGCLDFSVSSGLDLFRVLKARYNVGDHRSWWWGSPLSLELKDGFEKRGAVLHSYPLITYVLETILGQNTRYESVSLVMSKLLSAGVVSFSKDMSEGQLRLSNELALDSILSIDFDTLLWLVRAAGFYNQKAARIRNLFSNIKEEFGSFYDFSLNVDKHWLLRQSGIGCESASSILNYALKRAEMVVDRYTYMLLSSLGYDIPDYNDLQSFLIDGMVNAIHDYDFDISLAQVYARFHGKIVQFVKDNRRLIRSTASYKC